MGVLRNRCSVKKLNPLSGNPTKMVKHTQTIRRQQPTNCLSVSDYFVGLPLKGLMHFASVLPFISVLSSILKYLLHLEHWHEGAELWVSTFNTSLHNTTKWSDKL